MVPFRAVFRFFQTVSAQGGCSHFLDQALSMIKPVKPWLLALAMGATAAEMQPPVISLDLSQMARVHTRAYTARGATMER